MQEKIGSIWDSDCDYIAVTTNDRIKNNGCLVMGAGIAKQAATRYPELPKRLAKHVKECGNIPKICHDIGIVSFPTKYDWKNPSDIDLIKQSANVLMQQIPKGKTVAMSRPGCGNGNLEWSDVKTILEPILDDRFIIYSLKT
jgi:hypothetical protein